MATRKSATPPFSVPHIHSPSTLLSPLLRIMPFKLHISHLERTIMPHFPKYPTNSSHLSAVWPTSRININIDTNLSLSSLARPLAPHLLSLPYCGLIQSSFLFCIRPHLGELMISEESENALPCRLLSRIPPNLPSPGQERCPPLTCLHCRLRPHA